MSLKTKIKKVGAAAAGTLMLGATLGAAVSLADYPSPFVKNGEVQNAKQIVVGSQGSNPAGLASDIVGGIDIAASLGNEAVKTETKEKTVETEGSGAGWSATNGVTLDTGNDDLYFGNAINKVRQTLTQEDLSVLSETTFRDDSGNTYDITNYVNIDDQSIAFGNGPDGLDDEDPVTHVKVPAENEVSDTKYLYSLQASIGDVNFSSSDVKGETIELFGREYTVSDGDNSVGDSKLVLFGSSETTAVNSGETTTVTVGGEEHELEVTAVTNSNTAAITVDGDLEEYDEDGEFQLNEQTVRVDNIIQTDSQTSDGVVKFAMGSEELRLENGKPVEDGNGDDVKGTYVKINGGSYSVGDEVSSLEVFVGAEDSDSDYLKAGETFTHSLFDSYEVHFGGLNPNAKKNGEEIAFDQKGDEDATVSFTANGETHEISFIHGTDEATAALGDSDDNDNYVVVEGNDVGEDDYFFADAGDFDHMFEITNIDATNGDTGETEDGTIDIEDAVTGDSLEVDVTELNDDSSIFQGDKIIDGKKYFFYYDGTNVQVTWGSGADYKDTGSQISVFPALDTDSGASLAFTKTADLPTASEAGVTVGDFTGTGTVDLSSNDEKITLDTTGNSNYAKVEVSDGTNTEILEANASTDTTSNTYQDSAVEYEILKASDTQTITLEDQTVTDSVTVSADPAQRDVVLPSTESTDAKSTAVDYDSTSDSQAGNLGSSTVGQLGYSLTGGNLVMTTAGSNGDASVAVIQPEDNDEQEQAFVVNPESHDSDDGFSLGGSSDITSTYGYSDVTLESDDDVDVQTFEYGTYTEQNTKDAGSFKIYMPAGQSTAGVAVTSMEGKLSKTGGTGSATVEYTETTASGVPDMGMLDSEVTSSAKTSKDLILVGGPAVNALTEELASQANSSVWSLEDWRDGQHGDMSQVVLVEDAFAEGKVAMVVAGHEAEDTRAAAKVLANHDKDAYSDLFAENTTEITLSKSEYQTAWSN